MGQKLSLPGLGQMARAAAVAVVLFVEGVDAQGIMMVSTFSGSGSGNGNKGYADGTAANAKYHDPGGIDITPDGKFALVADTRNACLRKIDLATKAVTTLTAPQCTKWMGCMADGVGKEAKMIAPNDIHISSDGKFAMIADGYPNNRIRKLVLATNAVTTVATGFNRPKGVAISPDMKFILVADTNHKLLRKVDLGTKKVTTVAGDGKCGSCNGRARLDGKGTKAQFDNPTGVTISPDGKIALVADMYSIRKVVLATQVVSTLVGTGRPGVKDGVGTKASITDPLHIKISADGKFAVFSGNGNGIRKIDMKTAAVTTLAGAGVGGSGNANDLSGFVNGKAKDAKFAYPKAVAMPKDASYFLVADSQNHLIRRIGPPPAPPPPPPPPPAPPPPPPPPPYSGKYVPGSCGEEQLKCLGQKLSVMTTEACACKGCSFEAHHTFAQGGKKDSPCADCSWEDHNIFSTAGEAAQKACK